MNRRERARRGVHVQNMMYIHTYVCYWGARDGGIDGTDSQGKVKSVRLPDRLIRQAYSTRQGESLITNHKCCEDETYGLICRHSCSYSLP